MPQALRTALTNCKRCGVSFTYTKRNGKHRKYCSRLCQGISHSELMNGRLTVPRILGECPFCSKEVTKTKKRMMMGGFCSRNCVNSYLRGMPPGSKLEEGMKWCLRCKSQKPLAEFHLWSLEGRSGRASWCANCKNAHTRLKRLELRNEVIRAYGSACECCGENEPKFLAIDHVNNDGQKHRRETSGKVYKWLKDNNFPKDGFRLLCHNCNMARGFYGECPHKLRMTPLQVQGASL